MSKKKIITYRIYYSLSILILLNLALVIFSKLFLGCKKSEQKPNILFISIDDLRPELGCFGVDYAITPNIDALSVDGIRFTNAYCQSAVCNPSRTSLMTGLRPDSTKVWDLYTNFREFMPEVITLPKYFSNQGYHSVGIGKNFHNTFPDSASWSEPPIFIDGYPFDPDAVYCGEKSLLYLEERKNEIRAQGDSLKYIDVFGEWYLKSYSTEIVDLPDSVYYDGAQTNVAIRKLEELSRMNKPFFFGVGYYRPHLPFNAPRKYWDLYDQNEIPLAENNFVPKGSPIMAINNMRELRGYVDFKDCKHPWDAQLSEKESRQLKHGYLASVSYIDAQIGMLIAKLKALDLYDQTIIVIWGDNGYKLGEHGSWCKMTNYQVDTRVPLMIIAPNLKGKNLVTNRLVELVDLYPTLCELAGLPKPEYTEGYSMVPLIANPDRTWKKAVFSQYLSEGIWAPPDGKSYMGTSVRTDDFLYVEWMDWVTREVVANELYDLVVTPYEDTNVADSSRYQHALENMKRMLHNGWKYALPK